MLSEKQSSINECWSETQNLNREWMGICFGFAWSLAMLFRLVLNPLVANAPASAPWVAESKMSDNSWDLKLNSRLIVECNFLSKKKKVFCYCFLEAGFLVSRLQSRISRGLLLLLPPPPQRSDYRCAPLCLTQVAVETESRTLYTIGKHSTNWATYISSFQPINLLCTWKQGWR